jgi:hypothetical protein
VVELEDEVVVVVFAAISGSPAAPGAALFDEELVCFNVLDEVVLNGCKPPPVVKKCGGSMKAFRPGIRAEKAGSTL